MLYCTVIPQSLPWSWMNTNPDPDTEIWWEKHQIIGKEFHWRNKYCKYWLSFKVFCPLQTDPRPPQSGGWLGSRCREDSTTPETRTGSFSSCSSSCPASTPRYSQPKLWIEKTNDLVDIETDISRNLKGLVAIEIATAVRKKVSPRSRPLFGFSRPNPAENESSIANR